MIAHQQDAEAKIQIAQQDSGGFSLYLSTIYLGLFELICLTLKDVGLEVMGGVWIEMNALSGYTDNWEHTCTHLCTCF